MRKPKIRWKCKGRLASHIDNFKSYAEKNINNTPLHFEIEIQAPVEKVYETMLHDKTYREWTSIFNATSHFKGSWNKNEKILFMGTDADGKEGGMMSRIKENIPFKFVSIEHLGMINGEEEITPAKLWIVGRAHWKTIHFIPYIRVHSCRWIQIVMKIIKIISWKPGPRHYIS